MIIWFQVNKEAGYDSKDDSALDKTIEFRRTYGYCINYRPLRNGIFY